MVVGINQPLAGGHPMLDEALTYRARGLSVFPICTPVSERRCLQHGQCEDDGGKPRAGKIPLIRWREYIDTLPSEAQVRQWWARWPDANIGMATGAVSGVVVLDIDSGEARQAALSRGGLEDCPSVWTGKPGGCHFWLAYPGTPVRNFARRLPGLDFRGDGGYVLLPPSLHASGARYRWVPGTEDWTPPPIPPWLSDLLSGKSDSDGSSTEHEALDLGTLLDGVPQGERDVTLWRFASKLRGDDVPLEYALLVVRQAARLCRPPFDEDLAVEKVHRAYREFAPRAASPTLEVPEARARNEYGIQTLHELVTAAPAADEQLVEGILWRRRTTWVFSAPGVGKTLWWLAMGLHVAAGRPFCGHAVMQGAVLLLEEDSPLSVLAEYAAMLADIYEMDLAALPFYVNKQPGLRIVDGDSLARAQLAVNICPEIPELLLLDACERIVPSDKFTSKEAEPLSRFLAWALGRGITPNVIDHTSKKESGKEKPSPVDLLYGGRAKSAISDVMLYCTGRLQTNVRATYVKFRGATPQPLDVRFGEDEGFTVKQRPRPTDTPAQRKIMAWFNGARRDWYVREHFEGASNVPRRSGDRALAALVEAGWLLKRTNGRTTEYRANPDIPLVEWET